MKMTDLNEKYGDDDFGLKGHGSELDFDMRASDKDKSSADDNIIMQVRKAHQMRFGAYSLYSSKNQNKEKEVTLLNK